LPWDETGVIHLNIGTTTEQLRRVLNNHVLVKK